MTTLSANRRRAVRTGLVLLVLSAGMAACGRGAAPIRIGAVYPLSGTQGPGGIEEFHGVQTAVALVNADGGVNGRSVSLEPYDVTGPDGAPAAIDALATRGIRFVLGSYGSTISSPAADEAARRGMLFWETGAVGEMTGRGGGSLVFRVSPSGAVLGRSAVAFVAGRLAEALHRDPATLRFAVANVDDAYGRSVAAGAIAEIRSLGVPFAGQFPYDVRTRDFAPVVRSLAAARADVLFVSAYVADAVALRRETVRQHLPLVASIGTSSSYCMPQFGATLGPDAVGLFASDKPDADVLRPSALTPGGRALFERANAAYRARYGTSMTAAALAGFSGAWALLRDVLPRAGSITPSGVAAAALAARVAPGGLPNGSGLELVPPGDPGAGSNLLAASVIEEWVAPGVRAVVWPPKFATEPVRAIPLAS